MARNLVVCLDGTDNEFAVNNTNVVRLFQSLETDPSKQLGYYDPGVGTLPEPGFMSRVGQLFSTIGVGRRLGLEGPRGLSIPDESLGTRGSGLFIRFQSECVQGMSAGCLPAYVRPPTIR